MRGLLTSAVAVCVVVENVLINRGTKLNSLLLKWFLTGGDLFMLYLSVSS